MIGTLNNGKDFIFIHINKTAGTSIARAFGYWEGDQSERKWKDFVKHETAVMAKKRVGADFFNEAFKFSIVRNPWDRMVSMFLHRKYVGGWIPDDMTFREWLLKIDEHKTFPLLLKRPHALEGTRYQYTGPQLDWLVDENGEMCMDYVGHFEYLVVSWRHICRQLGIVDPPKLPHIFKSDRKPYQTYYDDETEQFAAERFEKDIKYFGYKF